ncbi:hypothetical protein ACFQZF_02590 [Flavobacterium myungsuense]|uniref:hypothetical protein n=1 Tax=Flavobacterium myungsuense TaxID=651823 RepID=UPI00363F72A9
MKEFIKYIFIVIIVICFFESCSKSDDDNDSKKKVIAKITLKSLDDIDNGVEIYANQTFNFSYVNGEVSKIESDNYVTSFNYDNKKLLSVTYGKENIDTKKISYSNNKIIQTMTLETMTEFFYDEANKLNEIQSSYIESNFLKKYSTKYFFRKQYN